MSQNSECPCRPGTDPVSIPVQSVTLPTFGMALNVNPEHLPGLQPGPDGYHLVSRDGKLVWEPMTVHLEHPYSLEEQWTGTYWRDGKKIYRKSMLIDNLPNSTTANYPFPISGLDRVTHIDGVIWSHGNLEHFVPIPYAHPNITVNVALFYNKTQQDIVILSGMDRRGNSGIVSMEYTCTDR